VATLLLQVKHHGSQLLRLHCPSDALVTNFPVLAKHAAEITPAEKNCPRSFAASKNVFLSMMRPRTMDDGAFACPADSSLNRDQAIHIAVSSAQVASFQMSKGLAHALS
jgi:hypothetical protein